MAAPEKPESSVLGLGAAAGSYEKSSRPIRSLEKQQSFAWRPSKVNEERLSSLSAARGRKHFAMHPRMRLFFTSLLFVCGAYFFVKLWLVPEAGQLHVALAIAAGAMVLLFVSAIIGALVRRHRKHGDDKSILRL